MSANVETMFSVREVPWHGLGTIVETAPTSTEALILAGLDWDVVKKPVIVDGNAVPGYVANVRTSDNSVLGIVSDRYQIVQNKQAFDFTDSLIASGEITYETAGSLKNGKTIWLLANLPDTTLVGDEVKTYICFTNSHDGKGAIRAMMTPVRVVCNNTLNCAIKTAKRMWSMKHVGDMESKLAEAREALGLAEKYMKNLDIVATELAVKKMSDSEIETAIFKLFPMENDMTDRQKNTVDLSRKAFQTCLNMDDLANFKNTAWGFVNAASDFVSHVAPLRNTQSYRSNNWGSIMGGHPIFDKAFELVAG